MANTTWNPADLVAVTLTGSNLVAACTGNGGVRSVQSLSTGKYYWENTYTTVQTNNLICGLGLSTAVLSSPTTGSARIGRTNGHIFINATDTLASISGGAAVPAGSVICFAVDFTAQLLWARQGAAGSWNGSGTANPATGTGGLSIAAISGPLFALMAGANLDKVTANFGDSAFTGTVPSGFTSGFPVVSTRRPRRMQNVARW
jgi:hypothetical protein